MAEDWERVFSQVSESKARTQEAGHEMETAWSTFLSNWLPPTYEVRPRKYIIGEVDTPWPPFETDLVVFRPSYPKLLRDKTHVLASGVAAAFSVKSTLRAAGIGEATRSCAKIQQSLVPREGSLRKELVRPFPYGLLAHSHDWKREGSQPGVNVSKELHKQDAENARYPKESIDFICVPDLGVWNKITMFDPPRSLSPQDLPGVPPEDSAKLINEVSSPRLKTVHIHTPSDDGGQAIAVFLTSLYAYLAMGDPTMTELVRSFANMGGATDGKGLLREWTPEHVLNPHTLANASTGNLDLANGENSRFYGDAMHL
jgi:hypothetical protein